MRTELDYCVVDAFTGQRRNGNPAAVVFGADHLDDDLLQAIAREFNQTATTFTLPPQQPGAATRFRFFTACTEIRLAGHAALAGVHALLERGGSTLPAGAPLNIETAGGALRVEIERLSAENADVLLWMDLPRPQLTTRSVNVEKLADLLGMEIGGFDEALPVVETQDEDLLVFVRSHVVLADARPSFTALRAWCVRHRIRGVCLATVNTGAADTHVQSRFFAPASGVNEDPATGSVHGPLAAYLMTHRLVPHDGRTAAMNCLQADADGRTGLIRAQVRNDPNAGLSVRIAGQCRTSMRGTFLL